MAVGDDLTKGPISSVIESLESKQSEDALSPEDLAWVDSCLVKGPETSDINWNSLKDVLLDILTSQPEPLDSSAVGNDSFPAGTDMEILPSSEEVGSTDIELLPSSEEVEAALSLGRIDDDHHAPFNEVAINEEIGIFMSQVFQGDLSEPFIGDAFLLKSKDGQRDSEAIDSGVNLASSAYEVEPSTEDIFRVWDLDIPAEEDELVKQLNKALEGSSLKRMPSTFDDSGALKDLKDESIDNLIAGIAELSLNRPPLA